MPEMLHKTLIFEIKQNIIWEIKRKIPKKF